MRSYYVYVLTNRSGTLYVGVTRNLPRRVAQHRAAPPRTFVARYRLTRLVHVETFATPREAIRREKQLKGWRRSRKVALINAVNPTWDDLAAEWTATPGWVDPPGPDPSLRSG